MNQDIPDITSPSPRTTTVTSASLDSKRRTRTKESQFVLKYGSKHHSYDQEKAPYPLSYDKHVLDLSVSI
jgi:hypothetical protein